MLKSNMTCIEMLVCFQFSYGYFIFDIKCFIFIYIFELYAKGKMKKQKLLNKKYVRVLDRNC